MQANSSTAPPLLDVRGVTLQYKTRQHLVTATYRVDFQVYPGERYILLGPSGCGKSTLLKAIGGYLTPTEGEIRLKGQPVTKPGPDRMMVFQEFDQLLPWKTVKENVLFPLLSTGKLGPREAEERALHYINKVNLTKFADHHPHMLSGGMKQRVAIARGMAMEPDVLLMDEPFSAVDAMTRAILQELLLKIWADLKITILFVTHDIDEAVFLSSRILSLGKSPRAIQEDIEIDLGYPRDQIATRDAPRFTAIRHRLFSSIFQQEKALA